MVPVAGVDGCRGGWLVVTDHDAFVRPALAAVLDALDPETIVAVDMPIGLLDEHVPGGRAADRAARRALAGRSSSVFSAPTRVALDARTLAEARALGCPMTIQALNILAKIRDVDRVMTPALQTRAREVHPELCFQTMNGGHPLASKKAWAGRAGRRELLRDGDVEVPDRVPGATADDILDAGAALWSARRIARGDFRRVPDPPPLDARGLRMEICW